MLTQLNIEFADHREMHNSSNENAFFWPLFIEQIFIECVFNVPDILQSTELKDLP